MIDDDFYESKTLELDEIRRWTDYGNPTAYFIYLGPTGTSDRLHLVYDFAIGVEKYSEDTIKRYSVKVDENEAW